MTGRATRLRRLAAGIGAVALTAGGMLAMAPAFADTPANIDKDASGSITVYKHVKDPASTDGDPKGAALEDVVFELQELLYNGDPIDLSTSAGWALAEQVWTLTADTLPTGFTLGTAVSGTTTAPLGDVTFPVDNIGVYLVTEVGSTTHIITEKAAPFWVTVPYPDGDGGWNYNVDVYPKNVLGTPGEPTKVADEEASMVGDTVTWTITMPVEAAPLPYSSFTIEDVLPAHLKFLSWGDVEVGATTLVAGDDDHDNDYTISPDDSKITFTAAGLTKLDAASDTVVTVTLVTEVLTIPADGVIKNEVTITINGQPAKSDGTTNWGEIKLHKYSSAGNASLAGAEFALYDVDPNTPGATSIATGTTNGDGEINWTVWVGNDTVTDKDFWIVETKAPAGHVLPANPVQEINVEAGTVEEGKYSIDIVNHKPDVPELPLTGSTGSMVFLLIGLGLIGSGATIAGVRKARMNS